MELDNPYDAPPGSIVIVGAKSKEEGGGFGGDISIKGHGDSFWNDGSMSYGGRQSWSGKRAWELYGEPATLLGVYVPTECSADSITSPAPTPGAGTKAAPLATATCTADATVSVEHGSANMPSPLELTGSGAGLRLSGGVSER